MTGLSGCTAENTETIEKRKLPPEKNTPPSVYPISSASMDTFLLFSPHEIKIYMNYDYVSQLAKSNHVENSVIFTCEPDDAYFNILSSRFVDDTAYVRFTTINKALPTAPVLKARLRYRLKMDFDPARPGIDTTFVLHDMFYLKR
ncbi:hypothetical protein [Hymenobacter lapidiphilus]|uniref:Uncharacterized protein n=1 Tax=Hymenobacter lapidiphilus TaxID=2608003 RepID=A0A7Y7PQ24_9BACT|nr:hypothetical protein [Hymenobacter lapidiphilus]NVO31762.1 hypothetical protein [Hymenobacter lapidiphilus]